MIWSDLCFETSTGFISFLLCGTNKMLRVIDLLIVSSLFQSFASEGKFISFQSYWFILAILLSNFLMVQCNCYGILRTVAIIIVLWVYCGFLAFDPLRRIYVWSKIPKAYLDSCNVIHQQNTKPLPFIDSCKPSWCF